MMTRTEYEAYRAQMEYEGAQHDFYVGWRLRLEGQTVVFYFTKKEQLAFGDQRVNGANVETKYDRRHAETGNLFIEIAEKKPWMTTLTPSGIWAASAATIYAIGDYRDLYIFPRSDLREWVKGKPVFVLPTGTGEGVIMRPSDIEELEPKRRYWHDRTPDGFWAPITPLYWHQINWGMGAGHGERRATERRSEVQAAH